MLICLGVLSNVGSFCSPVIFVDVCLCSLMFVMRVLTNVRLRLSVFINVHLYLHLGHSLMSISILDC